jgi:hypothetical protein
MTLWNKSFWKATAERAIKSAAQGLVLLIGGDVVFNAFEFDWEVAGGVTLGAAVLSVLTSIGSAAVTGDGPSLTHTEVLKYDAKHRAA